MHPILGVDHLVAMILVGLVSSLRSKLTALLMPSVFLVSLLGGGIIGVAGSRWILNEVAIMGSIFLLSAAVLSRREVASEWSYGFVALFGLAHGNAHGVELPGHASAGGFIAGFICTSIALHVSGVAIAILSERRDKIRIAAGLASIGVGLSVAVF